MREILADILKQTIGLFETIKVTASDKGVRLQAFDVKTKAMFFEGNLKEPVADLVGVFGVSNLALLRGLLDYPGYRGEAATFGVKRREFEDAETVEAFEFADGRGATAVFRCMSPKIVPVQAEITKINWDVVIPADKAKVAEFQQLSSLYGEVDKNFGAKTTNGNLICSFGKDNAATHRGSMVFAEEVTGTLPAGATWSAPQFLQMIKIAGSGAKLNFTSRGMLMVETETQHASYKYYLRAVR